MSGTFEVRARGFTARRPAGRGAVGHGAGQLRRRRRQHRLDHHGSAVTRTHHSRRQRAERRSTMQRNERIRRLMRLVAVADAAAGGRPAAETRARPARAAATCEQVTYRPGGARAGGAAGGRAARGLHGDPVLQRRPPGHRRPGAGRSGCRCTTTRTAIGATRTTARSRRTARRVWFVSDVSGVQLSGHAGRHGSDHHVRLVLRRRAGRPAGVRPMRAPMQGPRARASPSRSPPAQAGAATPLGPIPGPAGRPPPPQQPGRRRRIRGRRRRLNPASRAATCWSGSTNRSRGSW